MPKTFDDVNKLVVIDKCILMLIQYSKSYSDFLGRTLESNYNSYKENINNSKRTRCLSNINNNLVSLEEKKVDEESFNNLITDCRSLIKKCYKDNLVTSDYSRYLNSLFNNNIKDTINNFVKEYDSLCSGDKVVKVKKPKKKKPEVILPKITDEVEKEISYLKLDNLIYMHMKASEVFPFMDFDEESFMLEVESYKNCLRSNRLTIFEDLDKYELSLLAPFEKKRRNYVRSMFKTESRIMGLKYDTEEYFKTSVDVVNNLYLELNDFDDNNSSLSRLLKMTKIAYGGKSQLEMYKKTLDNIDLNSLVNCNFGDRYTVFSHIKNTVPSYDDIINILNRKIIERVSFNINEYVNNIDKLFDNTCEYMNEKDIIRFYNEIRNVLNVNSVYKSNNKVLIVLQKNCCNKLSSLLKISEDEVLNNYLKEEKIY